MRTVLLFGFLILFKKEYISLHIYTMYHVIKITFCSNSYSLQTVCKVKYKEMTLTYIYI